MAKAQSKTKIKKEIQAKSVGQNVILIIEGNKFSKRIKEKDKRVAFLKQVEAYNKRNSLAKEKAILSIMLEGKTTEPERKEKAQKAIKPKAKPKAKAAPAMSIAEAKKLLEKDGYTVSKKSPKTPPRRRGGEY